MCWVFDFRRLFAVYLLDVGSCLLVAVCCSLFVAVVNSLVSFSVCCSLFVVVCCSVFVVR